MMTRHLWKLATWIQVSALCCLLAGCAGKAVQTEAPRPAASAEAEKAADPSWVSGDSDSGKAQGLESVHFDSRSAQLDEEARAVLVRNAGILKSRRQFRVQLEGHCDQRGGIEQNFLLAERRAKAVSDFLVAQGVSAGRLQVISFGKERLLDSADSDAARRRNRRVNFVVVADQ